MKTATRPPGILSKPNCEAMRGLARTGNVYEFVREMSREFGDVVSLSPVLYMFSPSPLIKDALRNTADFRKSDAIETFKILVGEGLFTAQGAVYDQQERAVKSAFGKKYFGVFRRIIEEDVTRCIDERFSRARADGAPVDISALSVDLTMSIAARAFFGVGGETELAREFRKGLVFVQEWFAQMQSAEFAQPMLDYIEKYYTPLPVFKSLQQAIFRGVSGSREMVEAIAAWKAFAEGNDKAARDTAAAMRAICARIIALRREDSRLDEKNDVLSSLLRLQKDPENKWLTDEGIIDQVATFFVAGHETTSDLFVALLWKHARGETPAAVVGELSAAGGMIAEEQFLFQKYPATGAYIDQILLEHPLIQLTVRQANRDLEVGGHLIPEDTKVILAITSAQDVDVAFGFGRRQCIGRVFALEEAVIGLRHLVRHRLKLEDPFQRPRMTQGLTIGYSRSPVPILAKAV